MTAVTATPPKAATQADNVAQNGLGMVCRPRIFPKAKLKIAKTTSAIEHKKRYRSTRDPLRISAPTVKPSSRMLISSDEMMHKSRYKKPGNTKTKMKLTTTGRCIHSVTAPESLATNAQMTIARAQVNLTGLGVVCAAIRRRAGIKRCGRSRVKPVTTANKIKPKRKKSLPKSRV